MCTLDFLNQNNGAITAISTLVLAVVTFIYVILTWNISSETKKMREAQTEPHVSATIQSDERSINWINLVIKNTGLGPAYKVKFEVNPDFEDRLLMSKLSEIGFIKDGLPYFAPNQEFRFILTDMAENYQEKLKTVFKIKIVYETSIHKPYDDTYLIDFSQRRGLTQIGELPIYTIAKNIEQIQKDINRIASEKD
jgi:hypothetical protein